jgi:dienelactone hydrolase
VLACVGGSDKFCPPEAVTAFEKEMTDGNVDWQVNVYGGAVHAFTNPDADRHNIPNIKYDARADQRSFDAMKELFGEVFDTTGASDQSVKGATGNTPPGAARHG